MKKGLLIAMLSIASASGLESQTLDLTEDTYATLSGVWARAMVLDSYRETQSSFFGTPFSWGTGEVVPYASVIVDLRATPPYVNFAGIHEVVIAVDALGGGGYRFHFEPADANRSEFSAEIEWRVSETRNSAEYGPHPNFAAEEVARVYKISGPGKLWRREAPERPK